MPRGASKQALASEAEASALYQAGGDPHLALRIACQWAVDQYRAKSVGFDRSGISTDSLDSEYSPDPILSAAEE